MENGFSLQQKKCSKPFFTKEFLQKIKNQPFHLSTLYIDSLSTVLSQFEIRFLKAFAYFLNKKYNEVINELKNIVNNHSPIYIYPIYIYSLLKENKVAKALDLCHKALSKSKSSSLFWLTGRAYLQKKNISKAIHFLLKAKSSCPPKASIRKVLILADLGKAYTKKKNYSKALKYFSQAIHLYPNSFILLKRLGMYYFSLAFNSQEPKEKEKNFKLAIEYFSKALLLSSQKTSTSFLFFKLGLCNFYLQKFEQAKLYFEKSLNMQEESNKILQYTKAYLKFSEFLNQKNKENLKGQDWDLNPD